MERSLIQQGKRINLGLLLSVMLLMSCGTTTNRREFIDIKSLDNKKVAVDYNKQIKDAIEAKIIEREKECPKGWSEKKCKAMSRLYVEASVWADVLDGDWSLQEAELLDGFVYVTVKRGGEIPLIGRINVGKFKHVERVWVDKGKLVVEYKDSQAMSIKERAGWGGGGFLVGFFIALALILL